MKNGLFVPRMLAVLACLCLGALAWAQESITFTFQPPKDGITLIQTEKTTETKSHAFNDQDESETTVTITKTKLQYEATAKGWRYIETILDTEKSTDGEKADLEPVDKAFLKSPVVIEFDSTGKVVKVSGFDAIRAKMLKFTEGEEHALAKKLMTVENMEAMARAGITSLRNAFLGPARKPGDSWTADIFDNFFSTKMLPSTAHLTLKEIGTVNGRPSALITSTLEPDLTAVTRDLKRLMEQELEMFPPEAQAKYRIISYTDDSQDCIDAVLLTTLKSLSKRTRKYQVSAMGVPVVFTEVRTSVLTTAVGDE